MKNNVLIVIAAIFGLFATACSKSDNVGMPDENTPARLNIKIAGGNIESRATGTVSQTEENTVADYGVYVFNSANVLQRFAYFTSTNRQTIANLTTGDKKVVVLVNFGAQDNYPAKNEGQNTYADLVASKLSFTSIPQIKADVISKGLPMSGEESVILQEGTGVDGSNDVTIQIFRLVAKVKLRGITVNPATDGNITVNLKELGIMRAVREVSVVNASNTASGNYFKGLDDASGTGDYNAGLNELVTNNYDPVNNEIYFYVLPNTGEGVTNDNATLLTFVSDQTGVATNPVRYFPVIINPVAEGGVTGTDGSFLKRNIQYTLGITLQHHETGTDGPEVIVKPADIFVTVNINDWSATINQDVTWE